MMANNTWICNLCTFGSNKPLTLQCEVCGSMRPSENSPPSYPDAPTLPPLEKEEFASISQQYVPPNNSNSAANANGIFNNNDNFQNKATDTMGIENKATDTMEIDKNTNANTYDSNHNNEMEIHPNQEEIDMIFHKNENTETETSKKWNCLICTLENDAQSNSCIACSGPSVLKNDLWAKRICRTCYTINHTEATNCKNCEQMLTEIVDYDKNANLIIKVTDNKKDGKSYNNNNNKYNNYNMNYNMNHNKNYNMNHNKNHNTGFNDDFNHHYGQYNDDHEWDDNYNYNKYDETIPYNNDHNKYYSKQKKLHKKNKKKYHSCDYNYNYNPNINNNALLKMNNNQINSGFQFGSFGGFGGMNSNIFGGMNQNDNKQQNENEIPRVNVKQEYDKAMKTNNVARLRLIRRRQFVENDDGDAHFRICESQFMRSNQKNRQYNNIHAHANGQELNRTIQEVEYVINPKLINKFEAKKKHLMNKYGYDNESKLNIVLAWHGTAKQNVNGIVQNNFDLSRLSTGSGDTGWYGSGIYFSEFASISSGYGASLLLCKVILCKSYRMKANQQQTGRSLQNGYDSHVVVGHNNNQYGQEIVIFDVDQILPCYIVKY